MAGHSEEDEGLGSRHHGSVRTVPGRQEALGVGTASQAYTETDPAEQIVHDSNAVLLIQKVTRQNAAEIACAAGDQNSH